MPNPTPMTAKRRMPPQPINKSEGRSQRLEGELLTSNFSLLTSACEGYHTHYNRLHAYVTRPTAGRRHFSVVAGDVGPASRRVAAAFMACRRGTGALRRHDDDHVIGTQSDRGHSPSRSERPCTDHSRGHLAWRTG